MSPLTGKSTAGQETSRDLAAMDLGEVLRTEAGRRFVLRLLDRAGLHRTAWAGGAEATAFRLGEQNLGLWLVAEMERVGPAVYPRLLLGAAETRKEGARVLDAED